jgi:hypothetical protein
MYTILLRFIHIILFQCFKVVQSFFLIELSDLLRLIVFILSIQLPLVINPI